ncbi:hypothetical protein GC1_00006 [Gluconobacter phage GC1]|uniref:Uncharacterized protein n=1 Tax=Gluconobacter phage GC1 TaxID=2047788 RepID=A0A2I5AR60_9VIRU|nr:hypothetical protein FDJ08_gp06 [Gluconobacter phage GC1]ATS92574.1 hypothetical protein GC1_00006 [Gluconobacter phage GC1]
MSESTTATGTAATTTPAKTTLPAALDASTATLEDIVTAVNSTIAYAGQLPTSEGATLTSDQVSAVERLTSFFKI